MTRVKRGAVARQRRKKVLNLTSGARGSNSRLFRRAQQHARKALRYAYRGRRERKRQFRSLWIVRLNAATREHGRSYSAFRHALKQARCLLNRKTLSQLAAFDPSAFRSLLLLVAGQKSFFVLSFFLFMMQKPAAKGSGGAKRRSGGKAVTLPNSLPYTIDYKNVALLRRYIGITGKILPRRVNGLTAKQHRARARAIRQARVAGRLPFVWITD